MSELLLISQVMLFGSMNDMLNDILASFLVFILMIFVSDDLIA